jgi:hypothetical protein
MPIIDTSFVPDNDLEGDPEEEELLYAGVTKDEDIIIPLAVIPIDVKTTISNNFGNF